MNPKPVQNKSQGFVLSKRASRFRRLGSLAGESLLLLITSTSALAVLFIFYFIAKEGLPFVRLCGLRDFFTSTKWYPTAQPPMFGALAIFVGTGLVTLGAVFVAVPLGLAAAVCLSDVLPFSLRQVVKPIIEILAAIPSVAYGFFALVVFAPLLQDHGGRIIAGVFGLIGIPTAFLCVIVISDLLASRFEKPQQNLIRVVSWTVLGVSASFVIYALLKRFASLSVSSGANALNVSIILGIMAIPTIVSVAEDALQSVGREL
ncbi:MAG TPA: phosphate ABC transporter permease, partial [bacterium]|nr:phosphate ABC transporter permease [bacterium]